VNSLIFTVCYSFSVHYHRFTHCHSHSHTFTSHANTNTFYQTPTSCFHLKTSPHVHYTCTHAYLPLTALITPHTHTHGFHIKVYNIYIHFTSQSHTYTFYHKRHSTHLLSNTHTHTHTRLHVYLKHIHM
jgi:hypothetical protein